MTITVLMHLVNEEAVMAEMDDLPPATANFLTVHHPRRRDGKDIPYLQENVSTVIWAASRVAFIEILPGEAEERLVTFVRE
ncbi:MAG: hypothetical protein A2Z30_05690 [Chloroflexi bacterium RBG_16_64_43]|nr:MAG: hypothetical protein A2Z30_05690 [Chloroflexi bacterium RBG_16_64_43]